MNDVVVLVPCYEREDQVKKMLNHYATMKLDVVIMAQKYDKNFYDFIYKIMDKFIGNLFVIVKDDFEPIVKVRKELIDYALVFVPSLKDFKDIKYNCVLIHDNDIMFDRDDIKDMKHCLVFYNDVYMASPGCIKKEHFIKKITKENEYDYIYNDNDIKKGMGVFFNPQQNE